MTAPFRIATRGSPLALVQATEVRDRLAAAHPDQVLAVVEADAAELDLALEKPRITIWRRPAR